MELCYAHCSALTDPEKCSTGEKLMLSWAGRLEMSGRGKTSPHRSRCLEPAQWHRRASPAPKPADPRRRERQWNNWFLSSCEWKQGEGQRKRGGGGGRSREKGEGNKEGRETKGKKVNCAMHSVRFPFLPVTWHARSNHPTFPDPLALLHPNPSIFFSEATQAWFELPHAWNPSLGPKEEKAP